MWVFSDSFQFSALNDNENDLNPRWNEWQQTGAGVGDSMWPEWKVSDLFLVFPSLVAENVSEG
jgi:hypothetical protein